MDILEEKIMTKKRFSTGNKIIELDWRQFLKYKKWHSRMKAWNVGINNNLINESKVIYDRFI